MTIGLRLLSISLNGICDTDRIKTVKAATSPKEKKFLHKKIRIMKNNDITIFILASIW
jgi:hypothetical protein